VNVAHGDETSGQRDFGIQVTERNPAKFLPVDTMRDAFKLFWLNADLIVLSIHCYFRKSRAI